MVIRKFKPTDAPAVKKLHKDMGYEWALPNTGQMDCAFVVEDEGRVVMFAGAEIQAEIIAVCDHAYSSPHKRMGIFAALHAPLAEQLDLRGVKKATVHLDPRYRKFGKRLSQLGWNQALWEHYWMDVKQAVKALVKRG